MINNNLKIILHIILLFLGLFRKNKPIIPIIPEESTVSVIIPAYNEEKNISNVIETIQEVKYVDEIIVVNDGSTDDTLLAAKTAGASVVSHLTNQGKGKAIQTGFNESKGDIIAFIDADITNLTPSAVDEIINPILLNQTDITKTAFKREGGRVTELTAKPLLGLFFPEIKLEQPLSGQFAGKRQALEKINFEEDYGVDVGIVLDADIKGIKIKEVDIGEIKHEMSQLSDLNLMANEVSRTIIDRATKYGRINMMDTLGGVIRSTILGLSLMVLGFFMTFFVSAIPLYVCLLIIIIGLIITIYYLFFLFQYSIAYSREQGRFNLIKSFTRMHSPIIVSAILLIILIGTFATAIQYDDGQLSIELKSRNLVLWADNHGQISARGPYTIDLALEDENNMIRLPSDAMSTLGVSIGDTMKIGSTTYIINDTGISGDSIIRLPSDAREILKLEPGDVITDNNLRKSFADVTVVANTTNIDPNTGIGLKQAFTITSTSQAGYDMNIYLNDILITTVTGSFRDDNYAIMINGDLVKTFYLNPDQHPEVQLIKYNNDIIKIIFVEPSNTTKAFTPAYNNPCLSFTL